METIIHIGIIVCILAYFTIYLRGILAGKVKPVLATWLFLSLAVVISFVTNFHQTGLSGVSANFFNLADSFAVIAIFVIILFRKDTRRSFNLFEKWCIAIVIAMLVMWLISGSDIVTHLAIQLILVIAYLPSLVKLWHAKVNTESLGTWIFDCLASALGLILPIMQADTLPIVYGLRSVISTLLMFVFIVRLKLKYPSVHGN